MRTIKLTVLIVIFSTMIVSAQRDFVRWKFAGDGGISWIVKPGEAHTDNIEMSGKQISAIVTYGVNAEKEFYETKKYPRFSICL